MNLFIKMTLVAFTLAGASAADMTPSAWRAAVESLPDPSADAALEDLQEGCRIEVTTRNSLKPTGNASLNNFRAWTNSTGSYTNALYTNVLHCWLNNLSLNAAESNHLPMVKAAYLRQAWDSAGALQRTGSSEAWDLYATKVRTNGEALMTNAFMGASLSAANIEDLREYCIYIQMQLTGAERLPHQLGLTRDKYTPFEIGESSPAFMLRKTETVFDSPVFTNAALQDMTMFLKPKGVLEVLRLFTGYTNNSGTCTAVPFPASVSNETDYVRLQTNNTKPVVLMMGKSSDVMLRRNIPIMDTLYQAYKEVADIYIVHISYHDSYSTAPYYYGPYAGTTDKIPWQWTEEDFAQDVRRSMIRYPSVSIPFLTDEESHRNRGLFFTDGGDAHFVIIDREGKIAYAAPRLTAEGQNPFDAILQVNDVEYELRKVLANGGLAETGRDRDVPNVIRQALIDNGGISNYRPVSTVPIWLTGTITAINTNDNTVTVTRPAVNTNVMWGYNIIQENNPAVTLGASYNEAPKNLALLNQWIADGEKEYTLAIGTGSTNFSFATTVNTNVTEVYLNGLPVEIGSLAVGDFIGAMYNNTTDESSSVIKPLYFRASRNSQQIMVSTASLTINEGSTGSITVQLAKAPSGNVDVALSVSGDSNLSLITASPITFTTGNWDVPQTVTVQAAQDMDALHGTGTLQLTSSGLPTVNVSLAEADDEAVSQPAKNWRLIPLQIFDSAGSAGVSNLLQGTDGTAGGISANSAWTLTLQLPAMEHPGMLTYSFGVTNVTISAGESLDSTDGSDGSWQPLDTWTYRPKDQYMIDRLQKIELASSASPRWVRLTISNHTASAVAVSNLAAHIFNAAGTNDYWVWLGASIQEMSIRHGTFKKLIKDKYGYDPVVFNTAVGGWTSGSLVDNIEAILTNHPNAKYVAVHIGGNDVTGARPYPGGGSGLSNNLETICSTIRTLGMEPILSRISFRAYTDAPAVVVDGVIVNEENGSLPYNTNIVDKLIQKYAPAFYDAGTGAGIMDPYTYFLNHTNELSADGVHVGTEGKYSWNVLWADAAGDIVYPTNASPSTQISAPTTNLTAGIAASFSASASDPDGEITSYIWNFGDGSAITNGPALTNVTHSFLLSGFYTVTVTAQDDSGATNGSISATLGVSVSGSAGTAVRALIDFGSSTMMATGNWNNVTNNTLGVQVADLVASHGPLTGIQLEITDTFNDIRTANSVSSTLYPTNATRDYFRLAASVAPNDISGTIRLNGLNTGLLYDFTFYGGSTLSFGPTTRYIIGSSNAVLTHYNNLTNTAAINGVAPQPDGTITITVNNDGSGNGCLNAMEISYVIADEGPVTTNTLTVASPYGTPDPASGSHAYTNGANVAASISPAAVTAGSTQLVTTGWSGTGDVPASGSGTGITFTITQDSQLTWIWQTNYLLSVSAGANGGISTTGGWYRSISNASVSASPADGFRFAGWSGTVSGGQTNDNPLTVAMDQPRSITANFQTNPPPHTNTVFYADASQPDDSGDGFTWATAKKTIQAAVDLASDSNTVWVTNGVYSLGGRTAGGSLLTNRLVITNHVTVRSVNGPEVTSIAGSGPLGSAAVRCVYMSDGELFGFTLTNGHTLASGSGADYAGGGVFFSFGGVVSNCVLTGSAAAYEGGGAFIDHVGLLQDCDVIGNTAGVQGGGASNWEEGHIQHCTFSNNTAGVRGGGVNAHGLILDRCVFAGNASGDGGGLYRGTVQNSLFTGNAATNEGGGTFESGMRNCTISENTAAVRGGGAVCDPFIPVENSISYGNSAPSGSNYWSSGSALFTYSCTAPLPPAGNNNLDADPLFAGSGNYRLKPASPCIDSADNSVVTTDLDLDGSARTNNSTADMGAYESTALPDTDGDGIPNSWETQYFGGATNANPAAVAANGINTVLDCYIAGLNPTDAQSQLTLNAIGPLNWNTVSGRVYSILWSSNLLSGFQTLETNVSWPQNSWTDQVHGAEEQGFYQIKVRLK